MKYNDMRAYIKSAYLEQHVRECILDNYRYKNEEWLLDFKLYCNIAPTGIYCIVNLDTNKRYIGQSKNIPTRIRGHKSQLRKGKHPCSDLQQDWDNLTEEHFKFETLENCTPDLLNQKEVDWHIKYKHTPLYSDVYKTFAVPAVLWTKVEHIIQEYKDNRL